MLMLNYFCINCFQQTFVFLQKKTFFENQFKLRIYCIWYNWNTKPNRFVIYFQYYTHPFFICWCFFSLPKNSSLTHKKGKSHALTQRPIIALLSTHSFIYIYIDWGMKHSAVQINRKIYQHKAFCFVAPFVDMVLPYTI